MPPARDPRRRRQLVDAGPPARYLVHVSEQVHEPIDLSPEKALVLFSGGQDSATCLAWALARFAAVETIGFDYCQRHRIELDCRAAVIARLRAEFPAWDRKLGVDPRDGGWFRAERVAEHLCARAQSAVFHPCRGDRLSARHAALDRRYVRDRLFGLPGLPRRHTESAASDTVARHGPPFRHPYAADVARQGSDLGARRSVRRRCARPVDRRGNAQLLSRRPRASSSLGVWLRRMSGLQTAPARLGAVRRGQKVSYVELQ